MRRTKRQRAVLALTLGGGLLCLISRTRRTAQPVEIRGQVVRAPDVTTAITRQGTEVETASPRRPVRRRLVQLCFAPVVVAAGAFAIIRLPYETSGFAFAQLTAPIGLGIVAFGIWSRTWNNPGRSLPALGEASIEVGAALMTGAILGWVLFPIEENRFNREQDYEEARLQREERRDNIRFVREMATERNIERKPFADLDLQGATFVSFDFTDAELFRANLGEANLALADLTGAILTSSRLTNANLTSAHLNGSYMQEADLTGADLSDTQLIDADLSNADLSGANLRYTNFSGANLSGTNFTETDLTTATFTGASYDDTTVWPLDLRPPDHVFGA